MQTLDQQYSATAYTQVLAIKKEKDYKKYGAMAHKLPILIHTAGLAQALEFVQSRGEPIQKRLIEHLAVTIGQGNTETLLQTVRNTSLSGYIRLTRQILAALLWYKRFAQSILDVDVTEAAGKDEVLS
ncbi:MAG: type III-B CRISPR module-associated protein Cmr5 [Ktedonobacteraceae bacterium]|nr:type III-B CRISPR module-associated protein Cmr5 [Ktedonobacteraceae bacterium]